VAWDKEAFDGFYGYSVERWGHPNTREGVRLHYHWHWVGTAQNNKIAVRMEQALGPVKGTGVILVGAGFGWTAEGLIELGADVVATDISDFVLTEQHSTEEAEIRAEIERVGLDPDRDKIIGPSGQVDLDPIEFLVRGGRNAVARSARPIVGEDAGTPQSRAAIKKQTKQPIKWILTEQVLHSMADADAVEFCAKMADFEKQTNATVVHLLSPLQPERHADGLQDKQFNWKLYPQWRTFLDDNGFGSHRIMGSCRVLEHNPVAYGALM
jgi:hypothetical protein